MKGLDAADIHEFGSQLSGPLLIHFRLATAGGSVDEMTHPFPIEKVPRISLHGRANSVLIHNGHWSDWEFFADVNQVPNGTWSDTRLMARLIAMHGMEAVHHIKRAGQKLAFLDKNSEWATIGEWDIDNETGVHFSNMYWDYVPYYARGPGYNYMDHDGDWDEYERWKREWDSEYDRRYKSSKYAGPKETVIDMTEESPEVAACTIKTIDNGGNTMTEESVKLGGWSEYD
jgi:hypothetical protein